MPTLATQFKLSCREYGELSAERQFSGLILRMEIDGLDYCRIVFADDSEWSARLGAQTPA